MGESPAESAATGRDRPLPSTLGQLKAEGYRPRSVKEEMRINLLTRLHLDLPLFPGIIGYDKTVLPGIVNAILSRHDFILLGLRGQAKSRILRALAGFLDELTPIIAGSDLNESPFAPILAASRQRVEELGDDLPIEWLRRDQRYHEKLATPDVTVADLVGDVDPIKAATKRLSYADEGVIHYGIIPRTNRGIFAINELPDLPPRIQVALLNVLEEEDIQIRGFPVRIPLDVQLVFSANPEDYTNRGNIITPLKDRIDSQIITHYPDRLDHAMAITAQEAWTERDALCDLRVPGYFRELIEEVTFEARKSEFVDQKSGVSARMPIALLENVLSNMERRAARLREAAIYPRLTDLHTALTAMTGKMELVYEGEQEGPVLVARKIIGQAVKRTFLRYLPAPDVRSRDGGERRQPGRGGQQAGRAQAGRGAQAERAAAPEQDEADSFYQPIVSWFAEGRTVDTSDDLASDEYLRRFAQVAGLREMAAERFRIAEPQELGLGMELVLEGLHQHSMLSKRDLESSTSYRDMLKAMFDQMTDDG